MNRSTPKPFAVFDVDGTIFKSSLAEKVIDACIAEGLFARRSFSQAFAYKRKWQRHNTEQVYQTYIHYLVETLVQEMAGIDTHWFNNVTTTMLANHALRKFGFPCQLIRTLAQTHEIIAISGSPEILVAPFLAGLPVNRIFGSMYEMKEGRFTGNATSIPDKAVIVQELLDNRHVNRNGSVAVGDTISDASIMELAHHSIMFNASLTLTKYGIKQHWVRVHEAKDQVTVLAYDEAYGGYVEQGVSHLMKVIIG